ncbi:MAG: DUF4397 domain-containing protein [Gemmatimonadota bacterium]|nr:DUF4397 domain-containing protein [Gemmatimonadota bacterium]
MRFNRMLLATFSVLVVAACSSDPVSREVSPEPFTSIRWVNAVPDTVAMDYRIVDVPSNASEPNLPFRSSSGNWRNLPPGAHQIKVFFTNTTAAGTNVSIVSQVFVDTTLTFDEGKKYTIVHYGFAKAGATPKQRLIVIEDTPPVPAAGQIGLRAINAAPALGTVDVYAIAAAVTGGATSGGAILPNIAPGAVTDWFGLPARPAPTPPATSTDSYRVAVTVPSSNIALVDVLAPVGAPAVPSTTVAGVVSQPLDAIAGTQQALSALTAVVFGPQVSYTLTTPTGATVTIPATTTGGVTVLLDKHPPRISP